MADFDYKQRPATSDYRNNWERIWGEWLGDDPPHSTWSRKKASPNLPEPCAKCGKSPAAVILELYNEKGKCYTEYGMCSDCTKTLQTKIYEG